MSSSAAVLNELLGPLQAEVIRPCQWDAPRPLTGIQKLALAIVLDAQRRHTATSPKVRREVVAWLGGEYGQLPIQHIADLLGTDAEHVGAFVIRGGSFRVMRGTRSRQAGRA